VRPVRLEDVRLVGGVAVGIGLDALDGASAGLGEASLTLVAVSPVSAVSLLRWPSPFETALATVALPSATVARAETPITSFPTRFFMLLPSVIGDRCPGSGRCLRRA
jgi:hypothetical protein